MGYNTFMNKKNSEDSRSTVESLSADLQQAVELLTVIECDLEKLKRKVTLVKYWCELLKQQN